MKCSKCGAGPRPAGGFTGGQQHSAGWPKHHPVKAEPCHLFKCIDDGKHQHVKCSECGHAETRQARSTNA